MGFFICRTHVKLFTFKDKKDKMYYINQLVLIDCIIIIGVYITFETNFFKKEIRDNFEITEMMKRAWAAQMEVLQVVAEICDKNNLQYFADWGTLLGAVRHKGFIPQDDDYLWKLIDNVTSLYHKDEAEYMTNYSMWLNIDNYKLKKEWYDKTVMLPFENIKIAAPMMYHEVLTAQFGDYMIPTQGATKHGYPFYGNMENELKKQIKATGFKGSIDEFCRAVSSGELSVLKKLQTDVILITQFEVLYNQLLLIYLI